MGGKVRFPDWNAPLSLAYLYVIQVEAELFVAS
jgi:hypothetical protein